MTIRSAEKISAEALESLVYRISGVTPAAVVSMLDPVLTERLCLSVNLKQSEEVTLEKIQDRLRRTNDAAFKIPEMLVVLDELPTTMAGKFKKIGPARRCCRTHARCGSDQLTQPWISGGHDKQ